MSTIRVPDGNTADIIIEGGSEDTYIIGDNNCGRIIVKGSFEGTLRIGKNNKADIEIADDNEGNITLGAGNKGDICINDVNQGNIKVGDDNEGKIKLKDDNEGDISVGDNNCGDIDVGDVNQGDIDVGDKNKGEIDIDNDNEGNISVGDGNKGDVMVGDTNQGKLKVGKDNEGKVKIDGDNEDDVVVGDGNKGDIVVDGDNDEDIQVGKDNCGDIIVKGDNDGTITVGPGNEGTIDPQGDQGTVNDPSKDKCKKFFREYDRKFLSPPPVSPFRPATTRAMAMLLSRIFGLREEAAQKGNDPDLSELQGLIDLAKGTIREFSKVQCELYEECFNDDSGELDVDAVQACFAAFANGETRDPDRPEGFRGGRPGEPDGSFFFLFAEFALLAISCDIDKDKWMSLLPSLIKVQEIFIQVYEPANDATGTARERNRTGIRVTKERKEGLHEKYKDKDFEELIKCLKETLKRSRAQKVGQAPRPSDSKVSDEAEQSSRILETPLGEDFATVFKIDGKIRRKASERLIKQGFKAFKKQRKGKG